MITLAQLKKIAPNGRGDLLQAIVDNSPVLFPQYGLVTKSRVTHFIAQIAHESDGFHTVVEYASGKAYEGRKDLGNTKQGDGVRFKGRGYIQLTGRANYTTYGLALGLDLVGNPKQAEIPVNALKIALEYWKKNGLNKYADKNDIRTITKKINGGYNGLADREQYLARAQKYLEVQAPVVATPEEVKPALDKLKVQSVEEFQEKKGLVVDGEVGPATKEAIERELEKPSVEEILKSPDVVAPVAVSVGTGLIGALSSSIILQVVIAIIVLSIFGYIVYRKFKD